MPRQKKKGLLQKIHTSNYKIKPFDNPAIRAKGIPKCTVIDGTTSVPVEWYIIECSCETVPSCQSAKQLRVIDFKLAPNIFQPINLIHSQGKDELQLILGKYPHNYQGLGNYQGLHINQDVKQVVQPKRTVPYHLQDRTKKSHGKQNKKWHHCRTPTVYTGPLLIECTCFPKKWWMAKYDNWHKKHQ